MYEYKSEILKIVSGNFSGNLVSGKPKDKTTITGVVDELINKQAAEGWEFVCHSIASNPTIANYDILLTFRKPKN